MESPSDRSAAAGGSPPLRPPLSPAHFVGSKRRKSLSVDLSPKFMTAEDAISTKLTRRESISIRHVHPLELSVRQAEVLKHSGAEFLVSPEGTNSNAVFQDMKQTLDVIGNVNLQEIRDFVKENRIANLYSKYVGVGWRHCEYDLLLMVMDTLDFLTQKYFKEENATHLASLVPMPFGNADGYDCRYILLANFVRRGVFSSQQQSLVARTLLNRVEGGLLRVVSAQENNLFETDLENFQVDVRNFTTASHLREGRIFGVHIFSSMLQQWVEDFSSELPPIKPLVFRFGQPAMLKYMALRALVLSDLKAKFVNEDLAENCPFLHKVGFLLAHKFMNRHAPFSLQVSYDTLSAVIVKDGETIEDITIDHIYELRGVDALGVDGTSLVVSST